jgi:hypothetical protein
MGESFFNLSRIAWLMGIALLVMVANVVATIFYMVVYSYLIDPGHQKEYYDAHIQIAAPYCSIVAGIPLMFLAGWCVGGWWREHAVKSALVVWFVYAVIDVAIILAAGALSRIGILVAVSIVTKVVAVYLGASYAGRRGAV